MRRTLHFAMMGVTLAAVVALGLGLMQPWESTATAQHGQPQHGDSSAPDPMEHFHAMAEHLGLSDVQREVVTEPFMELFDAMNDLAAAHGAIKAELNDVQKPQFTQMIEGVVKATLSQGSAH